MALGALYIGLLLLLLLLLLVKFIKHNQKILPKTWRFDLYQKPSSEEAGTQGPDSQKFLRFS